MTEGYDSISYDKKIDYREICDALKWLCEMKDYGREFNVDRKTFTAIGKSFEGRQTTGDTEMANQINPETIITSVVSNLISRRHRNMSDRLWGKVLSPFSRRQSRPCGKKCRTMYVDGKNIYYNPNFVRDVCLDAVEQKAEALLADRIKASCLPMRSCTSSTGTLRKRTKRHHIRHSARTIKLTGYCIKWRTVLRTP